ncbi:Mur ligase [Longibacter salinarum]|uniref:Mur ligase n=1 Tax=Longibacter salinarum TaxID=1850348 RepID=A0A2A8CXC1_9BACT|nr:UDP-N-acetylmuramoyl-tripeptide--D-alanyl-D-alanine ligase [Longibacter salinarum]PEN13352.1 Mur ligase [Longibacter salinarum]
MTVLLLVLALLASLFAGWRTMRRVRFFLHVFQLETYKLDRFANWCTSHITDAVVRVSHVAGVAILLAAAAGFAFLTPGWVAAGAFVLWTGAFISSKRYRSTQQKKPLAFTSRMTRLAVTAGVVSAIPVVVGGWVGWGTGDASGAFWYLLGLFVADLAAPIWVAMAAGLMTPVETSIQEGYKRQARAKLQERSDLHVIGITGSYGKTSTKFILAELLRQKFNVLATPSSYNTPMGICIVVNNKLRPEHQVLVLEYGIRYPGDIEELTDIARPDTSVVTTIGIAHLETMGTQDAIAQEKGTLVEHTAPGGPAVLNLDDPRVEAMRERADGPIWGVSLEDHPDAKITASNISYDTSGTRFTVQDDTGAEAEFRTRLLGRHNVVNILLAIAVARSMGLRLRAMAHAIRRVDPVEHRLELRQRGAITVIDDAFNSNPVGARNAVEILGQMNGGRRVIVTPGMVELGERQWGENKQFGVHIAENKLDLAVLVGPDQTEPIREGLREAGFPEHQTKVFSSLFDAQEFLQTYLREGDIVLYENDLPDQLEE